MLQRTCVLCRHGVPTRGRCAAEDQDELRTNHLGFGPASTAPINGWHRVSPPPNQPHHQPNHNPNRNTATPGKKDKKTEPLSPSGSIRHTVFSPTALMTAPAGESFAEDRPVSVFVMWWWL